MGRYWSFEEDLIRTTVGEILPVSHPGEELLDEGEEEKIPEAPETAEGTWFVFDSEPNMDDIYDKAGQSLEKRFEQDFGVFPFKTFGNESSLLFLARFEFPKYGEGFQFPEAIIAAVEDPKGFIDFLIGVPIECIEMLMMVGEYSSDKELLVEAVQSGEGGAAAPVPDSFFEWPEEDRILMNYTALAQRDTEWMAQNLAGEPEPESHFWLRVNLEGGEMKYPVPGEFFGLGVRLMPDKPWGKQESTPFLYSGNWMDTVYYTGARITEVIDPTDLVPYSTYKVQWRKDEITARPSDFAEYRVGDRVTILKDVSTTKKSQLWKDADMDTFGETWMIIPIGFYGLDAGEE